MSGGGGGGLPPLQLATGPSTSDGTAAGAATNRNELVFKSGLSSTAVVMIAAAVAAAGWFIGKN